MILEMRIYSLKPGRAQAALDKIGRALPGRLRLSALAAMWYADTGHLDRIYHLWPFAPTNPVYINGRAIRGATPLQENDEIKLGNTLFVFKVLTG